MVADRRQRKKAEVRKRLYTAALHLFMERGYESTTVQEITDLADVAKATFFNYFPTKEHVLAAYHDAMTREILQELNQIKPRKVDWTISSAMEVFASWAEKNQSIGRVILRTIFGSDVLMRTDERNEQRLFTWFRTQIQQGIEKGELRRDLDPDLMCSLLIGMISASVQECFVSNQAFELRDTLREKARFLLQLARAEGSVSRSLHVNRRKA